MNPLHNNSFSNITYFAAPPPRVESSTNQGRTRLPPAQPTQRLCNNRSWQNFIQYINRPDAEKRHAEVQLDRSSTNLSAEILANKPKGTLAVSPDGNYLVSSHAQGSSLNQLTGFQVLNRHHEVLGNIEIRVTESAGDNHAILAYIDKGEIKQKGVMDFAMWYITANTKKSHVTVRNILNPELMGHLGKTYEMKDATGDDLFHKRKNLFEIANNRLTERGWNLERN
jgi:hypothetical protein